MIPINLTISGFLSYRDPVEIDFTTFDLACIAGHNGAGKSSILDAITWALFGQARKRDDSIINMQSETAEVSLAFEYEGNMYRVMRTNPRGKTTQLEFQIANNGVFSVPGPGEATGKDGVWKTLSERTLRATQERIEETLRLDYETFINAAFFLQGKADQFTQQRPGDRKRILANILGLEVWDTYRARAVERRKSIEADMVNLDGRLAEINAELAEEQDRKARLEQLQAELEGSIQARTTQGSALENIKQIAASLEEQRKWMNTLSGQLASIQKRREEQEKRLASRQKEAENHGQILSRETEIRALYGAWQEAREALAHWDQVAEQFREQEKRREEPRLTIEADRARLVQEKENLKEQEAAVLERQSSLADLQTEGSSLQVSITQIQAEIDRRKGLEIDLTSAQETLANARAENPRLKAEMDELKARIDQLTETEGAACPLCGQPLSGEERLSLVAELNILGKAMGDKYRANRSLLAEADEKVKGLRSAVESLTHLDDTLLVEKDRLNRIKAQGEQIQTQVLSWESDSAPRLKEITQTIEGQTFAPEARKTLAGIDAELKEIGYDAGAHDDARKLERESQAAENDLRALERAKAALEPLEDEINNLKAQVIELQRETEAQQAEFDQAGVRLASAEAQAPDLHQAQLALLDLQERENQLRLAVGAAHQKVMVLADLKARRDGLEADRENLAQKMGQYKQLERAFSKDGVPALLIEQALPQIENKANELLERLSGGNMSVRFITQREYKDKSRDDLRETLDIQISDNAGVRDYEMFSGGEAFRVNFAIRLALSEVLAQRAGARLQTLVIDEGFGSQDAAGRQRLIEAINIVKKDFEKILVITHIESLKDAFPARIEVEKTGRGSVVNILQA